MIDLFCVDDFKGRFVRETERERGYNKATCRVLSLTDQGKKWYEWTKLKR